MYIVCIIYLPSRCCGITEVLVCRLSAFGFDGGGILGIKYLRSALCGHSSFSNYKNGRLHFSRIAGVTLTFLCNLLNQHPIPDPSSVSVDLLVSISNYSDPWNTPAPAGYLLSRRRYLSLARDSENPRFGQTKSPSDY